MDSNDLRISLLEFHPILIAAILDFILLILLIVTYSSSLSKPASFEIRLPRAVVTEGLQAGISIIINAENILYLNNKVVTLNELKKELAKIDFRRQNIFIRVDRRATISRVIDVLDLSRSLGSNHVHIIESMEN